MKRDGEPEQVNAGYPGKDQADASLRQDLSITLLPGGPGPEAQARSPQPFSVRVCEERTTGFCSDTGGSDAGVLGPDFEKCGSKGTSQAWLLYSYLLLCNKPPQNLVV